MEQELSEELKNKFEVGKDLNKIKNWFLVRYYNVWIMLKNVEDYIMKLFHKYVRSIIANYKFSFINKFKKL